MIFYKFQSQVIVLPFLIFWLQMLHVFQGLKFAILMSQCEMDLICIQNVKKQWETEFRAN